MGRIFYCDYKLEQDREKRGNLLKVEVMIKPRELSEKMKRCCCESLHDQLISISEKSKITLFTLMRYLKSVDCDHFGEDWISFSKCQIALTSSPVLSTVLAHNDN